jgi:hypothetical protein
MTNHSEIRIHQEVDLEQQCRYSDAAIQTAMDVASKKAGKGLAPELLKSAGFAYGEQLYEVQSAIAERDAASPLRGLSKQQQLALTHEGSAWLPFLLDEAECWLADGRPKSAITPSWASTKVTNVKKEAAAERKRHAVPQPTTAEVISTLKREKEELIARLEKADRLIAIQAAKLQERN